jgi:uncharacterized cupredoxin-like copper-binding protein
MKPSMLLVSGVAVAVLALAGCGGGDDNGGEGAADTTAAQTGAQTGTTAGGKALTIQMGDYSFTPMDATTSKGTVTISAPNQGQLQHELVLLKTNQNAASLPLNGDEVDEEGLEAKGVENAGEIEDVGPGQTKSGTFKLAPGKYAMICNLPGHYQRGMYGTLTVK